MLKHIVEHHEGLDPTEVEFRMKAVKFHQSAFERQIFESVKIQTIRDKHNLLNSKSEYNRCALPRLGLKMGEADFREKRKEEEEEKRKDEDLEEKIRGLKKSRMKQRRRQPKNPPARKKMKLEDGNKTIYLQERNRKRMRIGEKREHLKMKRKTVRNQYRRKERCTRLTLTNL